MTFATGGAPAPGSDRILVELFQILKDNAVESAALNMQYAICSQYAICRLPAITNPRSPPKPMSIELVMPCNHLILCSPLLLLPSIFPSIRVFYHGWALCIRWPKYWSFSISISTNYSGLISFRIDWFDLLAVQGTPKSLSSTTIQKHQLFGSQPYLWSNSHICT